MKNILAENLLRFGVKNLSEADKLRLEQKTPTTGGGGAVAGKTPTTVKPPQGKKVVASFKMSVGAGPAGQQSKGITENSVYGILTKDPKTGKFLPPNTLTLSLSQNKQPVPVRFVLVGGTTYQLEPGQKFTNGPKLVEFLRSNTGHIESGSPATALMQVIENIKNETGVNVSIDSTVVNNIRSAYDVYWKTGIVDVKQTPITSGVLKPFKRAILDKYINPETNQEYIDNRKLVLGNGAYGFWINNDKIAGLTNVGTKSELVTFLRQSGAVPENMDTSTILAKAKAEAQAYYDQLNQ